uniref:TLDc domain-containing protein n=1 Tax=Macrostomum lignano TaxID=282301 RepID=A0A1I8F5L9_9PLAT
LSLIVSSELAQLRRRAREDATAAAAAAAAVSGSRWDADDGGFLDDRVGGIGGFGSLDQRDKQLLLTIGVGGGSKSGGSKSLLVIFINFLISVFDFNATVLMPIPTDAFPLSPASAADDASNGPQAAELLSRLQRDADIWASYERLFLQSPSFRRRFIDVNGSSRFSSDQLALFQSLLTLSVHCCDYQNSEFRLYFLYSEVGLRRRKLRCQNRGAATTPSPGARNSLSESGEADDEEYLADRDSSTSSEGSRGAAAALATSSMESTVAANASTPAESSASRQRLAAERGRDGGCPAVVRLAIRLLFGLGPERVALQEAAPPAASCRCSNCRQLVLLDLAAELAKLMRWLRPVRCDSRSLRHTPAAAAAAAAAADSQEAGAAGRLAKHHALGCRSGTSWRHHVWPASTQSGFTLSFWIRLASRWALLGGSEHSATL